MDVCRIIRLFLEITHIIIRIMNERGVDMCSVAVKIPDEVLYDTKMTEAEANAFAKRATALMLYTQNHISIGYCAQIAGMVEEDFIKYLSDNGISKECLTQ